MKIKLTNEQVKRIVETLDYEIKNYLGFNSLAEFFGYAYEVENFEKLSNEKQMELMIEELLSMQREFCESHADWRKIKEVFE
jgi:hypothetical protein